MCAWLAKTRMAVAFFKQTKVVSGWTQIGIESIILGRNAIKYNVIAIILLKKTPNAMQMHSQKCLAYSTLKAHLSLAV